MGTLAMESDVCWGDNSAMGLHLLSCEWDRGEGLNHPWPLPALFAPSSWPPHLWFPSPCSISKCYAILQNFSFTISPGSHHLRNPTSHSFLTLPPYPSFLLFSLTTAPLSPSTYFLSDSLLRVLTKCEPASHPSNLNKTLVSLNSSPVSLNSTSVSPQLA